MPRTRPTIVVLLALVGLIVLSGQTCISVNEIAVINSPQPGETIPASGQFTVSMEFVSPLTSDSTLEIKLESRGTPVATDRTGWTRSRRQRHRV